ncbi:murein DD-endopeptidase MepM [Variibacter gotjawalensis]|uniref:Murein DD-endopeptidase MepM n=1 Tax=Variibacter gotjawalensis TaxID=1333996 RepID=A0A0S3PQJ7_9BRAD|nr:M23 family metallopeptidase [Variibacter gotjawalensis]NIK48456.1 murein DD-endopeptidase MepM/ murein hydrolase activator NlpD [Variibacter gotjawalensis]RZS50323.1 murein DD-endopeptidase MepM/ murein hydrolase activator NlpD [Variibacter gotjawalensis]BAT58156.1 murein DD-endopeptidase MepM [Variibacter gotjawalensis]
MRQRAEPDQFDLGDDPPLSADGVAAGTIDRRRVSLRWYSGTILSGLCGAALMGGAVYGALDGEAIFAATPQRIETRRETSSDRPILALRKSDKISTETAVSEGPVARQVLRVQTASQVGERETVRVRPYVRVATNLALSVSDISSGAANFSPRATAPTPTPQVDEPPASDEQDATITMRELAPVLMRANIKVVLPAEDVLTRVRDAASWSGGAAGGTVMAGAPTTGPMAYASEASVDPYAGLGIRVVPENITRLSKTPAGQPTGGSSMVNEKVIVAKKGDSITTLLKDLGATEGEASAIASALGARGRDGALRDGQKIRVLLSPVARTTRVQPVRVIVMGETSPEVVVALSDIGKYVSVDVQSADTQVADNKGPSKDDDEEEEDNGGGVRLQQSIYETALRQGVPRPLIDAFVRVYSTDINFQRKVQPGDSLELVYPGEDDSGATNDKTELLYASLTIGGETRRYYRFLAPDDNVVDYFDEGGKSSKKFLVRKPIDGGAMRSPYGWRRHPILGYSKMHTGVDWAAPRGTQIYASGNGVIEKAGWEGGYGKYIRVKHANGYETAYGHMSGFARGISVGTRVRQGQLIGYVGSTGLSTGPHVHYEVLVNGRFVDPVRIKLPRGRALEGNAMASFERERAKIDAIINRSPTEATEAQQTRRREASSRRR